MTLIANSAPVRVMASGAQDVNHLTESYDDKVWYLNPQLDTRKWGSMHLSENPLIVSSLLNEKEGCGGLLPDVELHLKMQVTSV